MGDLTELLETWEDDGWDVPIGDVEPPELAVFKDMALMLSGGVYVLLKGIVIVYVGQARCFAVRVIHHRDKNRIQFDGVKVFPCKHKGRRMALERALIKKYNPKWNSVHKEVDRSNVIPLSVLMAKRGLKVIQSPVPPMNRRI